MKTNRVVIVQCRLSSTRLPGKALMDLGGKPVLAWVLNSMHKVQADRYFVATDQASYEQILPVCTENDFECFAGSLNDVLQRFVDLLNTIDCKTVIRATADNPFLFYEAAEESCQLFEEKNSGKEKCDYLTYSGLPHGSGVEIISADSLKKAITETDDPYDHEHVGPALYNHKEVYNCQFVPAPRRFNFPELRTTIDTYSDYIRAKAILKYLKNEQNPYTTEQILEACNQPEVINPVVLVPSVIKGHGTGHLRRCLQAAVGNNFFVYIPNDKTLDGTEKLISEYEEVGFSRAQIINQLPDETLPANYVTDCFELSEDLLLKLKNRKTLIAVDEGSNFSDSADFLLDIIPSYNLSRVANKTDSGLITKPENRKNSSAEKSILKILVCLGGEDPAGLTVPSAISISKVFPNAKITAILNSETESMPQNVWFTKPIKNLREKLYEYDVVVTHYGLTAFEAAYAGCGVVLLPTTELHKKLAEKYNFAYISDTTFSSSAIKAAFNSKNLYPELSVSSENSNLTQEIKKISKGTKLLCPVCGKVHDKPDQIVSRNEKRTYRRCQSCGIVYISYTLEEEKQYHKAYFFDDYKKQYGKTYEEDFESIKKQGIRRVEVIKSITGQIEDKNILDIGCAYGPFLSAAADQNMNPFGTDISDEAIEYVQNELKYPAVTSAYPSINVEQEFGISQFDVVTMWYVIEHFKDLDSVLRKTCKIVKTGGIFAFSTPSGEGISAKSDKHLFYTISPSDHYSVWEPSKAASILNTYGFKIEKIVSTGHHPERFPFIKNCGAKPGSLKWKITDKISHAKKLGDTMEIYCRKIW